MKKDIKEKILKRTIVSITVFVVWIFMLGIMGFDIFGFVYTIIKNIKHIFYALLIFGTPFVALGFSMSAFAEYVVNK